MHQAVSSPRQARITRTMRTHQQRWNARCGQQVITDPWADATEHDRGLTADEFSARWDELQHPPSWVRMSTMKPVASDDTTWTQGEPPR